MLAYSVRSLLILVFFLFYTACAASKPQEKIPPFTIEQTPLKDFSYKKVVASNFDVAVFYKVDNPDSKKINIYIEGDGFAWKSRTTPSSNPTPRNPLVLNMMNVDQAENIIYIARPCQYIKNENCTKSYWTNKRFAKEVIADMGFTIDLVINTLFTNKQKKELNLIGYSGGGAISVILTSMRDDVVSLRTVAGNLSSNFHSNYHGVSKLFGSEDPFDYRDLVSNVDQIHYVGGKDSVVPIVVAESFVNAMDNPKCVNIKLFENYTHSQGWLTNWNKFANNKIECG